MKVDLNKKYELLRLLADTINELYRISNKSSDYFELNETFLEKYDEFQNAITPEIDRTKKYLTEYQLYCDNYCQSLIKRILDADTFDIAIKFLNMLVVSLAEDIRHYTNTL